MAVTTSTASNPLVTTVVTASAATTTVETAATGNKTLYAVEIVNGDDSPIFVHLIDAFQNSNTTTAHQTQLYCAANTTCYYYFPVGYLTTNGIQFYVSTTAGGGANSVAPTGVVSVKLGFTAR